MPALRSVVRFELFRLRGENLSSNVNPSPRPLMLVWLGDFDNEAEDPDDIMRSVRAKDGHSLKVHPVYAAVRLHDAELTRFVLGTVRPERLGRDRVKGAPILRMDVLQEQMKVSRRIARNSEDLPHLA
jgi:hypothetical protein